MVVRGLRYNVPSTFRSTLSLTLKLNKIYFVVALIYFLSYICRAATKVFEADSNIIRGAYHEAHVSPNGEAWVFICADGREPKGT